MSRRGCLGLVLLLATVGVCAVGPDDEQELIQDRHFRQGFILWETKPGRHVRYGELRTTEPGGLTWGLSQWSSRFPLGPQTAGPTGSLLVWSNAAKRITLRRGLDIAMAVNSAVEYGPVARTKTAPWVHLLAEQEFAPSASFAQLTSAVLHVEARLLRARNLHHGDYSPDVHAAQFQIFFTVQNRNRKSQGHGDLLWFGVPLYDSRHRFPMEFKARDFGGTAKFIFTPGGQTFTTNSTHDGQWVIIDKEVLPLMKEALALAWARGFLPASRAPEDYHIGGMNIGWEMPGSFDVEMQVRNLSLKVKRRPAG